MGTKQCKEPSGLTGLFFLLKVSVKNVFKPGELACLAAFFRLPVGNLREEELTGPSK